MISAWAIVQSEVFVSAPRLEKSPLKGFKARKLFKDFLLFTRDYSDSSIHASMPLGCRVVLP